jgi:hAT family C-terminal dimerisation region
MTPTSTPARPTATIADELGDYISNLPSNTDDGIQWWLERDGPKKQLPSWAIDILSAPSSEAFVERVFSACGDFTTGKRNRTLQSLERKVFIKLNKKFIPK